MKQIFLFLMLCMPVFVFGEGLEPDSSMVDSTGTVHYDKLTKWYNRVYDRWESGNEVSFTYPQHNLTPWFFFSGITVNPVGRLTVGASYVFFLGLYHPEGEKRYLTSHGIGGSLGYRLFQANHDRYLFKKDFVVELRVRYAHSLGGRCDLEYNLYDAGLLFYNKRHKRIPYFTIGYRNVDSRTDGIRNMNALYLSITLR